MFFELLRFGVVKLCEKMAVGKADEPVEIFKARSDKREYRRIVLQNSLEVLLITDPETDKVSCFCDFF